jgi:hypothetical protein
MASDETWAMQGIGCCLVALQCAQDGLTLIAASEAQSKRLGLEGRPRQLVERVDLAVAEAQRECGDAKAQQALSRRRQMRWDQSVGLALRAATIARNRPGLAAA